MNKEMRQIVQAQKQAAQKQGRAWWFGPDETRFFDSRIEAGPYFNPGAHPTRHYFVTSEQCHFGDGTSAPRLYSVRYWDSDEPESISTWGRFQQFKTKKAAGLVAMRLGVWGKLGPGESPDD